MNTPKQETLHKNYNHYSSIQLGINKYDIQ